MATGKVKKVIVEKGYGFIKPDDGGGDIFFHHSSLATTRIEDIEIGIDVTYEVTPGPDGKGPRAANVTPVE